MFPDKTPKFTIYHIAALLASGWFLVMCASPLIRMTPQGTVEFSQVFRRHLDASSASSPLHHHRSVRVPRPEEYPALLPLKYMSKDQREQHLPEVRRLLHWDDLDISVIDKLETQDSFQSVRGLTILTSVIGFVALCVIVVSIGALVFIFAETFVIVWIASYQTVERILKFAFNIPGGLELACYHLLGKGVRHAALEQQSIFTGFLLMCAAVGLFATVAILRKIPHHPKNHGLLQYALICAFLGTMLFHSTYFGAVFAALLFTRLGLISYADGMGAFLFGFGNEFLMVKCLFSSLGVLSLLTVVRVLFQMKESVFEPGLAFFGGFGSLLAGLILSSRWYHREQVVYVWSNVFFMVLNVMLMSLGLILQMSSVTPVSGAFLGFWVLEKMCEIPLFHKSATLKWLGLATASGMVYWTVSFVGENPEWFVNAVNGQLSAMLLG
jgi:hypothetical protein